MVKSYPHATAAFTESLFYLDGHLYGSTGELGVSGVRKLELETGQVLQHIQTPPAYFGEGIVAWHDRLIQRTWASSTTWPH